MYVHGSKFCAKVYINLAIVKDSLAYYAIRIMIIASLTTKLIQNDSVSNYKFGAKSHGYEGGGVILHAISAYYDIRISAAFKNIKILNTFAVNS